MGGHFVYGFFVESAFLHMRVIRSLHRQFSLMTSAVPAQVLKLIDLLGLVQRDPLALTGVARPAECRDDAFA